MDTNCMLPVTAEADLWAVGVLAFELAYNGDHPFCPNCTNKQVNGTEPSPPSNTLFGWIHPLRDPKLLSVGQLSGLCRLRFVSLYICHIPTSDIFQSKSQYALQLSHGKEVSTSRTGQVLNELIQVLLSGVGKRKESPITSSPFQPAFAEAGQQKLPFSFKFAASKDTTRIIEITRTFTGKKHNLVYNVAAQLSEKDRKALRWLKKHVNGT